ncbi:DUF2809 domain-containing protein [Flavobacterium eburneipallidum]|uniref:ribosomal maturation YjgA family protein n=1 Tax=Flavobacterium eburneipallidum TaxID=3003263 RepID=UPI0022AC88F2|nr:DUF2809 domain-containing protein [Flavobacterium eburneipallidum]
MTKPNPFAYFILIILVIILGILSRKISGIPSFIGDVLYAVMVYFGMRFLFINKSHRKSMALALIFCFSIEFLQLYRAEWIINIRRTSLGHYVLGEGFLWSDLVCYVIGIGMAFLMDYKWIKNRIILP